MSAAPLERRVIWLDTDPGVDDWIAWLLLAAQPHVGMAGVSIVAGNAPLDAVLDNALRIRAFHRWTVPVHAGAAEPLNPRFKTTAENVLGAGSLASTGRPLPPTGQSADSRDAVAALLAHLRSPDGPGTLIVALGPLTNLALAWQRDADALRRATGIVWMGGSTERGNHTPAAEFNAAADPEAADLIFRSGMPVQMFGLNLCRQLGLTQAHVQALRRVPGATAAVVADHLDAYQRIASADGSLPMPLYDPAVALWCRAPGLFTLTPMPVEVELTGTLTRGMTVCDVRNRAQRACHADVAMQVDAGAAMDLFVAALCEALRPADV